MGYKYATQFYIDETNKHIGPVVRWNSNNLVPFEGMLNKFLQAGLIDQQTLENSNQVRQEDTAKFLAKLRVKLILARIGGFSKEESSDARASFGPLGHEYVV